MIFTNPEAEIFVPYGASEEEALARTTHIGIGAHQDDLEIMAYHGILECFQGYDQWFTGVTVTDGAGSPRADIYEEFSDMDMQRVRKIEQKKAAAVGEYSVQVLLDFPSSAVKDPSNADVVNDIKQVLQAARPKIVYTHNLADKHDTHVAVVLRVIQAIRELPAGDRPEKVYGCETWRDLDWLSDEDKVIFDVSAHENLAAALIGVFDSQISGGKRYDLATFGRRRANATFFASHGTDTEESIIFGIDLTPLIKDPELDIEQYIISFIHNFAANVSARIGKHLR